MNKLRFPVRVCDPMTVLLLTLCHRVDGVQVDSIHKRHGRKLPPPSLPSQIPQTGFGLDFPKDPIQCVHVEAEESSEGYYYHRCSGVVTPDSPNGHLCAYHQRINFIGLRHVGPRKFSDEMGDLKLELAREVREARLSPVGIDHATYVHLAHVEVEEKYLRKYLDKD